MVEITYKMNIVFKSLKENWLESNSSQKPKLEAKLLHKY